MKSNRFFIFLIVFIIPIIGVFLYMHENQLSFKQLFVTDTTPLIHIGGTPMYVEVARSEEERTLGLSGRSKLSENKNVKGLLFMYPEAGTYGIWMKDMQFSIDIVWIDESLTIVGIERKVSPKTYPKIFRSSKPVKYVLETEAGYTSFVGINEGQKVRIDF